MPDLFICTIGGEPRPIAFSIAAAKPDRIFFIGSAATVNLIESAGLTPPSADAPATVADLLRERGFSLNPGLYDTLVLGDPQDLARCISEIRDRMEPEVARWCSRGGDFSISVDFTGGTKVMTGALTLVSRRWPCEFRYVGGAVRTNNGVGRVETGSEVLVRSVNPWNALGYETVDIAAKLADSGSLRAAALMLESGRDRATEPSLKRSLQTLKSLIDGLGEWDAFRHEAALRMLRDAERNSNDLRAFFNDLHFRALTLQLADCISRLQNLNQRQTDYRALTVDLLANAARRMKEGRWDDAVARCYRAIEAIAQARLAEQYGIPSTGQIPEDRIPISLRAGWAPKNRDGVYQLALQDDYKLLDALDDSMAKTFRSLGLHDDRTSPLQVRNTSICGHGDTPVSATIAEKLFRAASTLAGVTPQSFPQFPALAPEPAVSAGSGR